MDPGISILIAATVALFGWAYTNRTTQLTSRRQHTFQFYYDFKFDKDNDSIFVAVVLLIKSNKVPDPSDYEKTKDNKKIDKALDQYEYISAAVFNGDMDENFVRSVDGSMFIFLATNLDEYITKTREDQGTVFRNLTNLALRWQNNQLTRPHRLYEWWRMRPYTILPVHVRWLNANIF